MRKKFRRIKAFFSLALIDKRVLLQLVRDQEQRIALQFLTIKSQQKEIKFLTEDNKKCQE